MDDLSSLCWRLLWETNSGSEQAGKPGAPRTTRASRQVLLGGLFADGWAITRFLDTQVFPFPKQFTMFILASQ